MGDPTTPTPSPLSEAVERLTPERLDEMLDTLLGSYNLAARTSEAKHVADYDRRRVAYALTIRQLLAAVSQSQQDRETTPLAGDDRCERVAEALATWIVESRPSDGGDE